MSNISENLENWMGKLPDEIQNVPVTQLAIPGSHNSSSYTITTSSSISPDATNLVKQLGKIFGPIVKRYVYRWSVTQRITIGEQLKEGIRYFDLRVASKIGSQDLYIVHGLYGDKIDGTLTEVSNFLMKHPDEVVILDFQHFYDLTSEMHTNLLSLIGHFFRDKLCPISKTIHHVTLQWMKHNGYQVIVIYRNPAAFGMVTIWPPTSWPTPWPETTSINTMISFLEEKLASRPQNAGFVTQCVITPDPKFILLHPLSDLEKSVTPCNKAIMPWLQKQSPGSKGINVVISDFIKMQDISFTKTVVDINAKFLSSGAIKN